jgi:hypothetical protein
LVLAIVLLVYSVERLSDRTDPTAGIDDVLLRELPPDVPRIELVDVTARAGITFEHFAGVRSQLLPEDMGPGLAWGDCDGDDWPDLYVVAFGGPLDTVIEDRSDWPVSQLYRNRGDGTFDDITEAVGADPGAFGMGASWADYDGDGDLDLYVTRYGSNVLMRNEGACRFVDVTVAMDVGGESEDFSAGATWGDYDADGDLDLYVTNYVEFDRSLTAQGTQSLQFGQTVPFTLNPAAYAPAPNRLFRNDGTRFEEVAVDVGVDNPEGRSLSASWADFDDDGWLDLYVANDISDNAFFRNIGGRFEDLSAASLTADYRGAMGLAVTDFDRDGDIDFFVTHWIAQENGLYANHLEFGLDDPMFADVAELMGLGYTALEYVGWGTEFVDYDNDGYKDLFVANGHTLEGGSGQRQLVPQRMQLFWRRGEEGFFDATAAAGPALEQAIVGRGAAAADYDRDGNIDVAVVANGGGVTLLRNSGAVDNHWAELSLRQAGANAFGLGARVAISAGGITQAHVVGSSPSYLSHNDLTVHFGLGRADRIESVTVRWPVGEEESWRDLRVDELHQLVRATGER